MDQGDGAAIENARRGDRDAFRVLVERHGRSVFQLACRMTGNQIDAEDISQETFLKAWREMRRFDGRSSFGTWLHRICANCALDHLRARNRRNERWATAEPGAPDPLEQIAAPLPSPERLAASAQVAEILGPAMSRLSEMERVAFVMRHYEGVGIEEIARALGVQAGAAKHTVFRAVQKLRRALEPAVRAGR
jgi:RNA polymerase sigma-70 factor (ECF subfamily)